MNVYSVEVTICGTLYVRAKNKKEAQKLADAKRGAWLELNEQGGDIPISGKNYADPDLPKVSLSPAMTFIDEAIGDVERADQ